ncbi:MAG: acetyltransferase [Pusillimonas sp.]|jgi:sugar O-acyltransferase (sialic acid O-acetyltransferase NeuD family)|nr:acetyltransferase [Pusillimonas sp.]
MKRLALLGASGHGKVVADLAGQCGWERIEFFDDCWPARAGHGAWPIVGNSEALLSRGSEYDGVLVSIGDCRTRWEFHEKLLAGNAPLVSIVHPSAQISGYASLGVGSVVMPCAAINIDASVGHACIVNTGATVDHDCALADAVHVSPGAHLSGAVTVGQGVWIGAGAVVKQNIVIGAWAVVGAGAVVLKPVAEKTTVVGNPARSLV